MTKLTDFLNQEQKRRCCVCAHEEVAAIIKEHLDLLLHGHTTITLHQVYRGLLFPEFQHPQTMDTVRNHARKCLGRDPKTGMPL